MAVAGTTTDRNTSSRSTNDRPSTNPNTSGRYCAVGVEVLVQRGLATHENPDGRVAEHLRRKLIPDP